MFSFTKLLQTIGGAAGDAFFNRVMLLLNTTSTNGAQNNTFQDSSSNNYSITRAPTSGPNAPTQGTFSPFSQTGWGNYFDGTDDYLAIADNTLLRFGAGAFTLEAWIYRSVAGAAHTIYAKGGTSTGIVFQVTSTNVLRFTHTTTNIDSVGTIAANTWTHVAVVREGTGTNQTKLYINGTQDGQGTVSTDFTQTEEVRIGTDRGATADFNGYISNLRFVKGAALYTATFTPSTVPLTTTSQGATATQVELLTCQSNRFLDNSSNAFAITITGTPSVQAFSPFAPTSAYNTTTVGGSGYFDRNGDYLDIASNSNLTIGTNNFTIAMWVYFNVIDATTQVLFEGRPSSSADNVTPTIIYSGPTSTFAVRVNGATFLTGSVSVPKAGQWYYLVVSRLSGTTILFENGVLISSATDTNNYVAFASDRPRIADRGNSSGPGLPFGGYISGLQVLIGTGVSSVTVPTAPPTAVANTKLLLNFTNAGIYDATAKSDLETVGAAQVVSPTPVKFGNSSMSFNGTTSYLIYPYKNSSDPDITQAESFTVELWLYLNSTSSTQSILDTRQGDVGGVVGWEFRILAGGTLNFYKAGGSSVTTTTALNTGAWNYIAVVKNAGTLTIYINGVDGGGSGTFTAATPTTNPMTIGLRTTTSTYLNGYIQDLRITRGTARTVTSVPSSPFPIQ